MSSRKDTIVRIMAGIILIGTVGFLYFLPKGTDVPISKPFIYFPYNIGEWTGKEKPVTNYVITSLQPDDILIREYENKKGEKFELYLEYFNYTEEKKRPHSPDVCWVGKGWSLEEVNIVEINLLSKKYPKALAKTVVARGGEETSLLIYCYKIGDKYVTSLTEFRIRSVVDLILKRRSNAFTLQLAANLEGGNLKEKEKKAYDFLSNVLSILEEHFLPEQDEKS